MEGRVSSEKACALLVSHGVAQSPVADGGGTPLGNRAAPRNQAEAARGERGPSEASSRGSSGSVANQKPGAAHLDAEGTADTCTT